MMSHTNRKAKKSYTLSQESVAFLENVRKRRRAPSASSVLEDILQTARRGHRRKTLDQAVSDYYDMLPTGEPDEQALWGEFALREFPNQPA
jgi:hypothetical protein